VKPAHFLFFEDQWNKYVESASQSLVRLFIIIGYTLVQSMLKKTRSNFQEIWHSFPVLLIFFAELDFGK
jgi:hypothetical protein